MLKLPKVQKSTLGAAVASGVKVIVTAVLAGTIATTAPAVSAQPQVDSVKVSQHKTTAAAPVLLVKASDAGINPYHSSHSSHYSHASHSSHSSHSSHYSGRW